MSFKKEPEKGAMTGTCPYCKRTFNDCYPRSICPRCQAPVIIMHQMDISIPGSEEVALVEVT